MNETECKLPPDQVKFPLGFFFAVRSGFLKASDFVSTCGGSARLGASRQID
jgi:hypothetical protein